MSFSGSVPMFVMRTRCSLEAMPDHHGARERDARDIHVDLRRRRARRPARRAATARQTSGQQAPSRIAISAGRSSRAPLALVGESGLAARSKIGVQLRTRGRPHGFASGKSRRRGVGLRRPRSSATARSDGARDGSSTASPPASCVNFRGAVLPDELDPLDPPDAVRRRPARGRGSRRARPATPSRTRRARRPSSCSARPPTSAPCARTR